MNDILWGLPRKRLYELREIRREQLEKEREELDKMSRERNSAQIRNQILTP